MAQSGASNHKFGTARRFVAQGGALWRKAALCGALEGKPDLKLRNSVEHYYTYEKNKFGAARRFVAQSGDLNK